MNLDELVLKSLNKRPLLREKIKEERKNKIYSSIENIENLISKVKDEKKRQGLSEKLQEIKNKLLDDLISEDNLSTKNLSKNDIEFILGS